MLGRKYQISVWTEFPISSVYATVYESNWLIPALWKMARLALWVDAPFRLDVRP